MTCDVHASSPVAIGGVAAAAGAELSPAIGMTSLVSSVDESPAIGMRSGFVPVAAAAGSVPALSFAGASGETGDDAGVSLRATVPVCVGVGDVLAAATAPAGTVAVLPFDGA